MRTIPLSKGHTAKICDCHYDTVADMAWHYNSRYAMHTQRIGDRKKNKTKHIHMSHLVAGEPPKGMEIDHINRDSLDNRCSNLRVVTSQQNKLNRTWKNHPNKGVSITKSGKYRARLRRSGILKHLGTFDTIEEALGVIERYA